ncbi:hypothetical protein [Gluconobacter roseus]|uniref:hypothetical protein n=1 Tax=Gluconobacter roseus TaxID=586239 RepID=UPI0038D006B5
MKRPWLTASLISVIAVMGMAGVHHEAHMELVRGLSSFRAALPPGTTFTYGSAKPAILSLGATLTDITLRDGSITLRATRMRLGHPRPTPNGGLSIRSVEVREPFLQTPTQIIHGSTLSLRQLILPPSRPPADGQSRIDLAHIALAHGQVEQFSVQNLAPSPSPGPINVHGLFASRITLDNYGPALVTTLRSDGATLAYERTVHTPGQDPQLVSGQASLERLDLKQKDLAAQIAAVWDHHPLPSHMPPPQSFAAHNFRLSMTSGTIRLDDLHGTGTLENQTATLTQDVKGFHFQSDEKLPFPINGAKSAAHYVQVSNLAEHTSQTNATLTIPDFMTLKADARIIQTDFANGHSAPQQILQSTALQNMTVSLQGDRLLDTGFALSARQAGNGTTADQLRQKSSQVLQGVLSVNPALGPVSDYVANPAGRTLTIAYASRTPMSLKLLNEAVSSPAAMMAFLTSPDLKASAE